VAIKTDTLYRSILISNATQSLPPCVSTGNLADDLWLSFVATGGTHTFVQTPPATSTVQDAFEVFSGTPTALTSMGCLMNPSVNQPDSLTLTGVFTLGQTYFIRVYTNNGSAGNFSFEIKSKTSSQHPLTLNAAPVVADSQSLKAAMPDARTYSVYPNPAHDFIYVKRTGVGAPNFFITDITGRLRIAGRLDNNAINVSKLSAGTYILSIQDGAHERGASKNMLFIKE
jgi:hypothetical protein